MSCRCTPILVLAVLSLFGCSSSPPSSTLLDTVASLSIRLATPAETSNAGTVHPSPYQCPDTLLFKSDKEFIVLVIELVPEHQGENVELVEIAASDSTTRYQPKTAFIDWWKTRSIYESYNRDWLRYLDRTYVPEGSFHLVKSHYKLFAVLMGKRPIPKPLSIEARFKVDGQERIFNISMDE